MSLNVHALFSNDGVLFAKRSFSVASLEDVVILSTPSSIHIALC